ncbi:hypothetical protein B0T26DRAFT_689648 [Lasiosphaeria miniovina]|uniref:Zn(2)-C6 fungal-type domain-containing protein n=1 Tax=Lasiosphaeria miniovina TaxID=1954250 RepID=A0AA40BID8_9PEZI|nr:uncharacterized protein B0T26DRAFT_689648 [Lasiosphaeria miniovina]KAK0734787.1 hypothetical protein B0T26DRAFT_689648 [Lasiosphaeria miniovina]
MVGVPSRSKACSTCKRRRKGCDLARPSCSQCRGLGIECGGYDRDLIFVVSTLDDRPAGRSYRLEQRNLPPPPSSSQEVTIPPTAGLQQPPSLVRVAYESHYAGRFWEAYMPRGRPIRPALVTSYICNWTTLAQRLYDADEALRFAFLANCLCHAARRVDGDCEASAPSMEVEGRRMYGRALASLKRSLSRNPESNVAAVIAAKLLSNFEMFFSSEKQAFLESRGWEQHHAGETALLVACGPAGCSRGSSHEIFIDDRVDLLLSAIKARKKSPLSTDEWKTQPWSETPKNLKDVLVDVLIHMPGLLEEFDHMRLCQDENKKARRRQRLLARCSIYQGELQKWKAIVCPAGEMDVSCLGRAEPTQGNVAIVHGLTLYWTTCILLYTTQQLASGPEPVLPAHADPAIYIRNIVDTVPLLLRRKAGLYGQHAAILPLAVALQYALALGSPMDELRERLMGILAEPSGALVRPFLIGYDFNSRESGDLDTMKEKARQWAGTTWLWMKLRMMD